MKHLSIILPLLLAGTLTAQPVLPEIFSDNMVLQQSTTVAIWGTNTPNTDVTLTADWITSGALKKTSDKDGKFSFDVPTLPAKSGVAYNITIEDKEGVVEFSDVVFGEVWLAGGQSNMALELSKSKDGIKYIADSENENIRFYYAPHVYFKGDKKREVGKWVTSNPNTVGRFSAVAYHFAVKLQQDLKVPVGIILCYKGGTPAESWMSKEVLEAKGFHDVYTFFEKKIPANYEEEYQKFLDDSKAYKEAEKAGNKPAAKPSEPNGWRNYKRPDGLYYLMLKPIIPYTVKGFLWYQAEANAPRYEQYKTLFPALIEEWRTEFNTFSKNEQHNENAPFIFAQLPPYNHPSYDYPAWALQREAQYYVANTVPNTSMVVTIDVGEKNDIHPLDKYPVGYRMALAAEGTTYNYNIVYKSPQLIDTKIDGNKIELTFDLFGSKSLEIANNEKNIKGFEISNKTGIFVDAVALIKDNNKIVVYSESIDSPVDVRYGWANWVEVNLTNSEGLWVSPFRIDKKIKQ